MRQRGQSGVSEWGLCTVGDYHHTTSIVIHSLIHDDHGLSVAIASRYEFELMFSTLSES